ncbi:TonB-dependent copper receptor [Thauera mechernichensis]
MPAPGASGTAAPDIESTEMNKNLRRLPLAVAISLALPALASAQDAMLGSVVVTAPVTEAPLTVTTDPKAPRQPLPAHDGADYLKAIPGFSVIRKGGADGDPVLRGMSGSRLGIVQDGYEVHGGCGGRMDPPTAYVYPESFDRVTVLKGPQTVLYGSGNSAGIVLFERDNPRLAEAGWRANGSLTVGNWGRNDQVFDAKAGNPDFFARIGATRSDSNNYKDGSGREVHSSYTRWSTDAALGWTPDDDTLLELAFGRSDGEAAYADRSMDGSKFAREHVNLKLDKRKLSPLVSRVEAQLFYSYIDHVMDNYSLRRPMATRNVSNPDRETRGARAALTLTPSDNVELVLGADLKDDTHTGRMVSVAAPAFPDRNAVARTKDYSFERHGVFGELRYSFDDDSRLIGGVRADRHEVRKHSVSRDQADTLGSGFVRYEAAFDEGRGTWYAGLGHASRFPDFWEYMRATAVEGSPDARTFDTLQPEKTTQLDIGALWAAGDLAASVSGFYGKIDDHILIKWMPAPVAVRNVDATVYGLEGDLTWRFASNWKAVGTLAWVRGTNDTDNKALAQQPPLEGRVSVDYDDGRFSYGAMVRLVAKQDRVDIGSGGIVANGADTGTTPGFATLSLNAGWRHSKHVLMTAGIDNVFDRTYREHLSKSGAAIPGYIAPSGAPINEPGRTFWLKAQVALD